MKELEERIRRDGTVKTGDVLKVDAFLNHQCDVRLFDHMGQEWARHFAGKTITKILTIEASGIGIACCAARHFGDVPVVFAKKAQSINLDGDQYTTTVYSFTKRKEFPVIVSKKYLDADDHVLLIDASRCFEKRRKGIGDKKNDITKSCRDLIVQAYSEYRDGTWTGAGSNGLEVSVEARLMETVEFGFNRVAVESPVVDEDGEPVLNKRGKMQADKAKEDTEDIPLTQDIDAYIEREVRPYNKYAWVDKKKTKVGYTVPFTRVFYKYAELEPADEIAKRILEHEKTLEKSLKALFGEVR